MKTKSVARKSSTASKLKSAKKSVQLTLQSSRDVVAKFVEHEELPQELPLLPHRFREIVRTVGSREVVNLRYDMKTHPDYANLFTTTATFIHTDPFTTCLLKNHKGAVVACGSSKRNPVDKRNLEIAEDVSVARATRNFLRNNLKIVVV